MKTILITGGAGNVGGALAERLVADKSNFVVIADNLLTGSMDKLPGAENKNWQFYNCDVNDCAAISNIFSLYSFDYVFHYAAVVGVCRTLENPIAVLNDINGIKNILELSKNTSVKRVFYSSSSEVYGEPVEFPQNEDTTPLNSRLPYAIVKNAGEAFFRSYYKAYGLPYTVFRFFNTFGPKQSMDFVVPRFIDAAINGKPLMIYGDGLQTRTFCYIEDNIDATIMALERKLFMNDVINLGNDLEITVLDLARTIIKITGSSSEIRFLPPLAEGDMTRRKPDITKMRILLCRDLMRLEEGIQKVIEHIYGTSVKVLQKA
jgi:UDP-glucuronate decarboxylase